MLGKTPWPPEDKPTSIWEWVIFSGVVAFLIAVVVWFMMSGYLPT